MAAMEPAESRDLLLRAVAWLIDLGGEEPVEDHLAVSEVEEKLDVSPEVAADLVRESVEAGYASITHTGAW